MKYFDLSWPLMICIYIWQNLRNIKNYSARNRKRKWITNSLKLSKNLSISHQGRDSHRLWSLGCCKLQPAIYQMEIILFLPGDPCRKMRKRSVLRKIWTQFVKSFCQNFLIALFKFKIQALVRLRRVFKLSLTKISFLAENRQIANCPCSIILFTHLSWNGK